LTSKVSIPFSAGKDRSFPQLNMGKARKI